jgi:cathepsin X
VYLNPTAALQVLINCGVGSCDGGNPGFAYTYARKNGIPDQTCQAYQAKNMKCGDLSVCETCAPTNSSFTPGACTKVDNPSLYYVSDHGSVHGADNYKAEIFARGPIGAGIDATAGLEAYTGGVYSEKKVLTKVNHEISIIGWGVDNGTEYWTVRNSWGTYWVRVVCCKCVLQQVCPAASMSSRQVCVHCKQRVV